MNGRDKRLGICSSFSDNESCVFNLIEVTRTALLKCLYVFISLFLLSVLSGRIETLLGWITLDYKWGSHGGDFFFVCFLLIRTKRKPITISWNASFATVCLPACQLQRFPGEFWGVKTIEFQLRSLATRHRPPTTPPTPLTPTPTKHLNSALFPQLGRQKVTLNKERIGRSLQTTHTQGELHFVSIAKATPFSMQPPGAIHEAGSLRTESSSPDRLPLTSCGRFSCNAASA